MMQFNSKNEWKEYCFNNNKQYLNNNYFCCWIKERNVCIFDCTKLEKKYIKEIKKSIEKTLNLFGNRPKVNISKYGSSQIGFAVRKNLLIPKKILDKVKKLRIKEKKCNAFIFIVNYKARSKDVLEYGDALTYIHEGVTIFTLDPSIKYPLRFFRNEVKHEIYHLLGFNVHHEDTKVRGYASSIGCVMGYNAPSEKLCEKCKDGLTSFIDGISSNSKNVIT